MIHNLSTFEYINLTKKIHEGRNGPVCLATDTRFSKPVIVKFIRQNKFNLFELNIQSLLSHENIVEMYCAFKHSKKYACLLLEYVDGLDLFDLIDIKGYLKEQEAFDIFIQVFSAVKYLHSHSLIHRDIKPENILIKKDGKVKLCDFGFSTFFSKKKLTFSCGSLDHAPPEILRGDPYFGPEIDVWCLGSCLFMMVTGEVPSRNKNENQEEICCHETFDKKNFSENLENLLRRMLDNDPKTRITIKEIENHPWVKNNLKKCLIKNDEIRSNETNKVNLNEMKPRIYLTYILDLIKDRGYNLRNIIKEDLPENNIYKLIISKLTQGYSINEIYFLTGFTDLKNFNYVQDHKKLAIKLDTENSCLFYRIKFSLRITLFGSINKLKDKIDKLIKKHDLKIEVDAKYDNLIKGKITLNRGIVKDFKDLIRHLII
ncbi:SNF-related serine/threonine-protein kinase [Nosema bombycis CQ1]|uniref:SNF-related serine/threonine-protein kinase n=1 Tax=Nosema bombycis (strain CQ1 / CVCC 102059) TaxID=578461 RepID=R0MIP1_NOSB1|nr:SNF-related serine/threonine-protein kinase [Nosema bombycis CQ1]|eukprot:EOB12668.1 SNF-related serine/threonine-protein kinase [Nosema bombycis CQ1]